MWDFPSLDRGQLGVHSFCISREGLCSTLMPAFLNGLWGVKVNF